VEPVLLIGEPGAGKVILHLDWPSPHAGRGGESASPLPRPWLASWSRRSANRASVVCWPAGPAWS
jgi:hypothetical protein